ncbi:hypothetical protein QRQ56_34515 [Bradyrhizobium sp. U531]|uniref:hypothetical protein n=1 Tax=Bradyrhizobium sp. U531 TaxID=3053458 RepID=UPI003F431545
MRIDLRRTEMGFTTLEFIRVALAKHEVSKKGNKKPIAFAPGLARPNRWCGSMEYEAEQWWRDHQLRHASRHRRDHPVHSRGRESERRGSGRFPSLYEPA